MRDWLTLQLLRLVWWLNPYKHTGLSLMLHDMADMYDTRPTRQWAGNWKE